MTMEGIELRRRLWGVDRDEVERLLADRELELGQLAKQARLAEERASEAEQRWHALEKRVIESEQRALSAEHELKRLQGMLSSLSLELARREQEAEALRLEAEDLRRQLETALSEGGGAEGEVRPRVDTATNFLVSEVAPILRAAEESAARVLRQARAATEQEKLHLERARTEIQQQLATITAWWNEVNHVLEPIQANLSSARKTIEVIGESVREALYPLGGLIGSIGGELAKLSQISSPPPMPPPVEIDPAGHDQKAALPKRDEGATGDRLTVSIEGEPTRVPEEVPAGGRAGRPWWPSPGPTGEVGR
jgi:DNA repair exonuclease SbcCD ATPase subunit